MIIPAISPPSVILSEKHSDEVHLFLQFYIDSNETRQKEIVQCLHKNIQNRFITKIHLLNERIYKNKELGAKSAKIVQTNLGSRLKYSDIFHYINVNQITGYILIANSDIFFDSTLETLHYTDIHQSKKMYAQLRYEYNSIDPELSTLFGPRADSQDVWILHTQHNISPEQEKLFYFQMGKPGCDNKLVYLFYLLGFQVLNDPTRIRTYHYHSSAVRNYTKQDTVKRPWGLIFPTGVSSQPTHAGGGNPLTDFIEKMKTQKTIEFGDNQILHDYILSKIAQNKPFVIPRIAGIENNYAWLGDIVKTDHVLNEEMVEGMQSMQLTFKKHAGIFVRGVSDVVEYSDRYLKAFEHCDLYTGWEPYGEVYHVIPGSHDYITTKYAQKQMVWAFALDIFHYIYNQPWTHALRGKRILVISSFEESIREKIPIRAQLYQGVDLFPDCEITTIRPPQTQGKLTDQDQYFGVHLLEFYERLDKIRDTYDIALVSCGGYGNLVCGHIFESGKSAIYVGGVLQMYFGILGSRWFRERPDAVRLFLNEHWSRPKDSEKPADYQTIEGACYW
jgi:hypothetical protein